jgi:PTS system mannose-specific IID component
MQSLGLVYALSPALVALYPDLELRQSAFKRHLAPFNTHPYSAAAIVGGILFHEQRIARGEVSAEVVERFKSTLMGPLAALGDVFFWRSFRPAVGAVSVALVPAIGAWAAVVYIVAYNAVHLVTRYRLFRWGLALGDELIPKVKTLRVPLWSQRFRMVAAGAAGGVASWLAVRFGTHAQGWFEPALDVASVAFGVVTIFLLSRAWSRYVIFYAAALIALVLSSVL